MSVKFDLTVIAPELLDAVVCMDNSPAYDAFKNEIELILADFNEKSHFGSSLTIDPADLTEKSKDTMLNMHRTFLLWTIRNELRDGINNDSGYTAFLKLFFKSNCDKLAELNGGSTTIDATEVVSLKEAFISAIGSDPALYDSLKEFFTGYVYGYISLNYLEEQTIMIKYAEFLVCIGIMTGKIASSVSAQQKIMPKMASLLGYDRFKYISGYMPLDFMLNIVYDRFVFPNLSDDEMNTVKSIIRSYMTDNYDTMTDDESTLLISDRVTETIMTRLNSEYVCASEYSSRLYDYCFSGVRTFMGEEREDAGEFTTEKICGIISDKCEDDFNMYFTTEREPNLDVALGGGTIGYKYPLVFKDAEGYWYSSIYQNLINELLDTKIYAIIDTENLQLDKFPFADAVLITNVVREFTGNQAASYSIRADKKGNLIKLIELASDKTLSDNEQKMLIMEQMLYIISGNCTSEKYNELVETNVFGGELYDEYVLYRVNKILEKGNKGVEVKKKLLAQLSNITV